MARLSFDLPDSLPFVFGRTLEASHCNVHHLDNLQLLQIVSDAREALWRQLGYRDASSIEQLGTVLADALVLYRSEAFEGERLDIALNCIDFNRYGCDVVWRVTAQGDGREVARGKWGLVFFDHGVRRVALLPPAFRAHFAAP